jgi:2-dehydro-3-deoxyphosphogluconate aldolase/(4S)-4-hydroxy-2-oxoglutarate aldolase
MSLFKIGIARGISGEFLIPAFEAAIEGGFNHLEVTMNTPEAEKLIKLAAKNLKNKASIGAGTVTTMKQLKGALDAGAEFIVSPVADLKIIRYCVKRNIPVFPGALTPAEILRAWEAGASMVKVFPIASMGGPDYVRELKGPFQQIKLLACGGVTPENLNEYTENGVDGIAIGSRLFKSEWLEKRQYEKITETALKYN